MDLLVLVELFLVSITANTMPTMINITSSKTKKDLRLLFHIFVFNYILYFKCYSCVNPRHFYQVKILDSSGKLIISRFISQL